MLCLAVDWGDFPTWVQAITTSGALFAAGWVVKIELDRDAARTNQETAAREVAERAEQADRVAAWHESRRVTASAGGFLGWDSWQAIVLNGSVLPVYDLTAVFVGPDGRRFPAEKVAVVSPGESAVAWPKELQHTQAQETESSKRYSQTDLGKFLVTITFRDTGNRIWERDEHGTLNRTGVQVFVPSAVGIADAVTATVTGETKPE
jgi:hypothetical protein